MTAGYGVGVTPRQRAPGENTARSGKHGDGPTTKT